MAEKLGAEELQAILDTNYPFIDQAPGRWVPDPNLPGGQKWVEEPHWSTRHGAAIVRWSLGNAIRVESARYPDGSRGVAEHKLDFGWRRRASDDRHWIHGRVDIQPADVAFIDGTQPVYSPPKDDGVPNLEAELARDTEFLREIQDDRFANAVYVVLRNRTFYKGSDGRAWACGDRQAARLVRDLRGLGESYQDWFPRGGLAGAYPDDLAEHRSRTEKAIEEYSRPLQFQAKTASVAPGSDIEKMRAEFAKRATEMEEKRRKSLSFFRASLAALDENADVFAALHRHVTRLGWRTERHEDRERARRKLLATASAVVSEIKELESRPENPAPDWVKSLHQSGRAALVAGAEQMSEEQSEVVFGRARRRLIALATSGRISSEEYASLSARLGPY
jgi:hypothetical protein